MFWTLFFIFGPWPIVLGPLPLSLISYPFSVTPSLCLLLCLEVIGKFGGLVGDRGLSQVIQNVIFGSVHFGSQIKGL